MSLKEPAIKTSVTTFYLEMTDPAQLRQSLTGAELIVKEARIASPQLNRFLYTAVGGHWYWIERLVWTYQQWLDYLDRAELQTWVGYVSGTPAGYFELEKQVDDAVEIASFGLLPRFIGQGLGGRLLSDAVASAWRMDAKRVWVHTCTLDGPAALANYQARGFKIYKEGSDEIDLPLLPPGPWPGAGQ